jgi:protocatechuate 3,4-dioxygenase, alpha subunit
LTDLAATPSQTVGPFFSLGLVLEEDLSLMAGADTQGEHIVVKGRVLDGKGAPVSDALVEMWQADHQGRYRHPADLRSDPLPDPTFTGFGRCGTDAEGRFRFVTIKPGPVPFDNERLQAPHLNLLVLARGLLDNLITRFYFDDEPANADDPVLRLVPAERRFGLIARREEIAEGVVYRIDVRLQGEGETAFLEPDPGGTG